MVLAAQGRAGTVVKGAGASPGRASGPLFAVPDEPAPSAVAGSFADAVGSVAAQLERLADAAAGSPQSADILRAQAAMARDPGLRAAVDAAVRGGRPLGEAIGGAAEAYAGRLAALDDPYLRERAADVREVGRLLRLAVAGRQASRLAGLDRPAIVVAHELSPADTLGVRRDLLLGIVTESGGLASHAAIIARELGIPAIVGAAGALEAVHGFPGGAIDGSAGTLELLGSVDTRRALTRSQVLDVSSAPVRLMANVGSAASAEAAAARGAAGVGLFRTELMFMDAAGPMSEDGQLAVYDRVSRLFEPHPVVVRTLDAGADKPLPYLPARVEGNPQLGRRGVRLWLHDESLWRPQVRALLRASARHPNLRVMLPMVAARSEMLLARKLFAREAAALGATVPRIGMMVEIPGVAAALRAFTGVADFISIGTNDLTQYALGADRELRWTDDLSVFNPGVLALIAAAVRTAGAMGLESGVCGEMAGNPAGAVFLTGVGVGSLSMTVDAVPEVLRALTRLEPARCRAAAEAALKSRTAASAARVLRGALAQA